MTKQVEALAAEIEARHALSSVHIFKRGNMWRVFGARQKPSGVQQSVDEGRGADIRAALDNLDSRLATGPFNPTPWPEEFQ